MNSLLVIAEIKEIRRNTRLTKLLLYSSLNKENTLSGSSDHERKLSGKQKLGKNSKLSH